MSAGQIIVLVGDAALSIEAGAEARSALERWLPRPRTVEAQEASLGTDRGSPWSSRNPVPRAVIRVQPGTAERCPELAGEPTIRLGTVEAWVDRVTESVVLHGAEPRAVGKIDLAGLTALLEAPLPAAADDIYSMLTISAALLLGRLGRTPVHAGAVVPPDGGALLLAGDARAGKSTTCINLIAAGWDYLSDDQVVLFRGSAGEGGGGHSDDRGGDRADGRAGERGGERAGMIWAEGWPRTFHLDEGWERGVSTGTRRDFDPSTVGTGRWRRYAPVEGLLFPIVNADRPTSLTAIAPADALARLVRQTPWLLADPATAAGLLGLLTEVANLPAFELSLGLDTYRDPRLLSDRILARSQIAQS